MWGNVAVDVAAGNVLAVLAAAGRTDVQVAIGAPAALGPSPRIGVPHHIHGLDGMGGAGRGLPVDGVRRDGVELLVDVVTSRPGEVAVVAVGPLTNVARAVLADPGFAPAVRELVVMGGAVSCPGNALPMGEANIGNDPGAAAIVVRAGWATPPMLVGLDVTLQATLSPAELALLAEERNDAARFLAGPLSYYRAHGGASTAPDCPCHDLVALLALADPALVTEAPVLPLAVDDGGGPAWGSTVVDRRAVPGEGGADGFSPWRIALGVDVPRFRRHVRSLLGVSSRNGNGPGVDSLLKS